MGRLKRIWYLSPMRAAKVQASLRIRAVSPEPPLLAHTSSESRGTFRQKARSLAPLNSWACAVKICHDGMLEDTNSLDGAHILIVCLFCVYTLIMQLMRNRHCIWLKLFTSEWQVFVISSHFENRICFFFLFILIKYADVEAKITGVNPVYPENFIISNLYVKGYVWAPPWV